MSARLKVEVYRAKNNEWSFRVIRGARIVLVAGETYTQRGGARRAVRNLAAICADTSSASWTSPLESACLEGLAAEDRAWKARKVH